MQARSEGVFVFQHILLFEKKEGCAGYNGVSYNAIMTTMANDDFGLMKRMEMMMIIMLMIDDDDGDEDTSNDDINNNNYDCDDYNDDYNYYHY